MQRCGRHGFPETHAFLYRDGQTTDLTPSMPTGPLGEISSAEDINDGGRSSALCPQTRSSPGPSSGGAAP